jgi:hypothetical protein
MPGSPQAGKPAPPQSPSRKRDALVPEAERYHGRCFSIYNRKSLTDRAMQLYFLGWHGHCVTGVDKKKFLESNNYLQRI